MQILASSQGCLIPLLCVEVLKSVSTFSRLMVLERQVQAMVDFLLLPRGQEGRPTDMFEVFRRYPRIMMIGTCDWSVANGAAFKSLPSIVKQTRAMRRDTSCHEDCSEANNTSMCMLHMCIDIFPSG